jgi:cytidine deaminase
VKILDNIFGNQMENHTMTQMHCTERYKVVKVHS